MQAIVDGDHHPHRQCQTLDSVWTEFHAFGGRNPSLPHYGVSSAPTRGAASDKGREKMKLLLWWLLIITSTLMTTILGSVTKANAGERQPPSIESTAKKWNQAIHSKRYDQARTLCESWLEPNNNARVKAEAHKCLANVELASSTGTAPLGTSDIIVGSRPPWYLDPGAGRAIKHLTDGIELTPDDITIHQGRLHIVSYSLKDHARACDLERRACPLGIDKSCDNP